VTKHDLLIEDQEVLFRVKLNLQLTALPELSPIHQEVELY